ncbi:hypothetical protein Kpol_1050p91 [Vanderwaltozyma polyspora DSM 70294]|uniref:DASH complex subunit DAM1 n=1 Tax=Vanderwaltozyma polyspora (strain ATCC 22028 / DSM 70294 / BCRC 21397 / CBS 2163 / NBRC 10782 / NRRL Y-8283 / UCD 57-17) TaxID=436907 RepID=A7TEY5_VANPO|nr:uncharacterized protein Kpol_1050p91 [Vanderwaltozyma polyspora DSM 70294]EDO19231.1 hypothetical protein Kpol_1050p91 [Vanderwaltozyma polyspora DSM 70294]
MSHNKGKVVESRPATEYKLSVSSNPSSRRASLGRSISESGYAGAAVSNSSMYDTTIGGTNAIVDLVDEILIPNIRQISDSLATLDKNFSDLNIIQENLVDFNESLGSLLYGLMCNSWCVAFPHVPNDIETEINKLRKLDSLESEKQGLIDKINALRNDNKSEFIQPVLTTSQARRNISRNPQLQRENTQSLASGKSDTRDNEDDSEDEEDFDDVNSEASFVLNPPNELAKKFLRETSTAKTRNRNSKLRRKSILHTIRNSIATSSDFNNNSQTNPISNQYQRQDANRQRQMFSLGSGASRIVSNPQLTQKGNNEGRARLVSSSSGQVNKKTRSDNLSNSSRPPFR